MAFNKATNKLTGTTGTTYVVAKVMTNGVIGYRDLHNGEFRIRVEPFVSGIELGEATDSDFSWKQPGEDGQNRFSTVVTGHDDVIGACTEAAEALAEGPQSLDSRLADALSDF
jgi:hypothetical protein